MIFKVCRMYTSNPHDREDLYQEIVMQLWRSFPKFRGQAQFSTWLYKVAINTAISGLQKKSKRIQTTSVDQFNDAISDDASIDDHWHELQQAIEKLNEVEKAVVMLYLEDVPYIEMESIIGINEATLRVKMNRIKQKLKKITNPS